MTFAFHHCVLSSSLKLCIWYALFTFKNIDKHFGAFSKSLLPLGSPVIQASSYLSVWMKPNGAGCGEGLQSQQEACVWREPHKLLVLSTKCHSERQAWAYMTPSLLSPLPGTTSGLCESQRGQSHNPFQFTIQSQHDLNSLISTWPGFPRH